MGQLVPITTERVLRQRYRELLDRGYTATQMAGWVWSHSRENGLGGRLERALGLQACPSKHGPPKKMRMTVQTALMVGRALGLDPIDFGL